MMISLARACPTKRMKRVVEATPSGTPRSTSGIQNWASAAAKRKSQARVKPQPPPTAWPLTMQMVACSRLSRAVWARSKSRRNWDFFSVKRRRRSSSVLARAWGASAPAEKTGGAPVTITTRVVSSSRSSVKARDRSVSMASLSEFRRSGRWRVTVTTAPFRSRVTLSFIRGSSWVCRQHGLLDALLVREELLARVADDAPGPLVSLGGLLVAGHGLRQDLVEEALEGVGQPAADIAVAADPRRARSDHGRITRSRPRSQTRRNPVTAVVLTCWPRLGRRSGHHRSQRRAMGAAMTAGKMP